MKLTHRAGSCDNGPCPNVFDTDAQITPGAPSGLAAVQGQKTDDPEALAHLANMPANETIVLVPPELLVEYVVRKHTAGNADPGLESFDSHFDCFKQTVFRLETRQSYGFSEEDSRLFAYRRGLPRPERSVRTSPWLRRIALTTAVGKRWQRVHVVDHPLTDYLQYQLIGYAESLAAGEEVLLADRASSPRLTGLNQDFWLFDEGTPDSFALLMNYDADGNYLGFEHTADPDDIARCAEQKQTALEYAVGLNTYMATAHVARKIA